jgi:hypothetical protein
LEGLTDGVVGALDVFAAGCAGDLDVAGEGVGAVVAFGGGVADGG